MFVVVVVIVVIVVIVVVVGFCPGSMLPLHCSHVSGLESVRTVLARVATVEVTLVEAVVVDVGLEQVIEREEAWCLHFQHSVDRRSG